MDDFSKYIGLEFEIGGRGPKYDCWGYVQYLLDDYFALSVPSFENYEDWRTVHTRFVEIGVKKLTEQGWKVAERPNLANILLFRVRGRPLHVGLAVGSLRFLHIQEGMLSVLDRLDARWYPRLEGIYEYH